MKIPRSIQFGVGDADLQVVGEQFCQEQDGSGLSFWQDSVNPRKVYNDDNTLICIDRYNRVQEDVGYIADLGVANFRTSVAMSRVLQPDLSVNNKAIEWYKRYFSTLNETGVKVDVTLYHWELPAFLGKAGGWRNPDTIEAFKRHVRYVYQELNEYISSYYVINEPWVVGFVGHFLGAHAPWESDLCGAVHAIHNLLKAQAAGVRLLKELDSKTVVGTVYNIIPTYARRGIDEDLVARKLSDQYFNRWFLDPLYFGNYPEELFKRFSDQFEISFDCLSDELKVGHLLDQFGINYYGGSIVTSDDKHELGFKSVDSQVSIKNDLGWCVFAPPVFPSGFYDLLVTLHARYEKFGMQNVVVSENGTAFKVRRDKEGNPDVNDEYRIYYLKKHIGQLVDAVKAGVPISKYFIWTLMDNFEWGEGYRPEACFGLIHVDRATLQRIPLNSYYWYREVIANYSFDLDD